MNVQTQIHAASPTRTEHFDVLIAGAGISGVGAAYHLTTQCPGTSFVALETQKTFGGTWSTHRYPGIRSDSDLHTFGYRFKPWTSAPIASAAEILKYMGEVIEENDLARHIRYQHKIISAKWSSEQNLWTIEAIRGDTGETVRFTTNFFWMCQGYYRHAEGYTPEWKDMARFKGPIVHPQKWPEDLDYKNKRVVVIGSGATAATLIPAMANDCAHVTMLQRSPTYFRTGRNAIEIAEQLRQLQVDEKWIHEITRRKILCDQDAFTRKTFADPQAARLRRHRDLSRHDVHRGAEPGLGVRLFPRQLDAARRSGRRFRLRLLTHMKETGAKKVTPQLRPEDHNMPLLPWIDPENFNPGYMMRGMHLLPKRGEKPEWQHNQDYWAEKDEFPTIDLKDRAFTYG